MKTLLGLPSEVDFPSEYDKLSPSEKETLAAFISAQYLPAKTASSRTSYDYKHDFEESQGGFYVTNGAFKGAMVAAGHAPTNPDDKNWTFRIKMAPAAQKQYLAQFK